MGTERRLLAAIALVTALAGCHKKSASDFDRVLDGFDDAGWKREALTPTDAHRYSAQRCVQGTANNVEVLLCEFGSTEAVAHGKRAGEGWVGAAVTGAVLDHGRTMLAVADRNGADPKGANIHAVTKRYLATQ